MTEEGITIRPDDPGTRVIEFLDETATIAADELDRVSYLKVKLAPGQVDMLSEVLLELKKMNTYLAILTDSYIDESSLTD